MTPEWFQSVLVFRSLLGTVGCAMFWHVGGAASLHGQQKKIGQHMSMCQVSKSQSSQKATRVQPLKTTI